MTVPHTLIRSMAAVGLLCCSLPGLAQDPSAATRSLSASAAKRVPEPAAKRAVEASLVRAPLTAQELKAIDESPTLQRIRQQQKLVIAFSKTASPFSVADADGQARGFAIDLCTKIATSIQRQLRLPDLRIEFIAPPFAERLQAVRDGTADMECANTISNAERRQTLGFTIPFYLTVSKILVKADSPISKLAGLRDKTVVTTGNSSAEKVLRAVNQRFAMSAKIITRPTAAEAFAAVGKGEADAFFMSDIVISDLLAKAPDRDRYALLRDAYSVDGIAIVLARQDVGMKTLADRELKRMMADGEIQRLYGAWFQAPIPPAQVNLNLRLNELTRDHYKRPSDEIHQSSLF